MDESRSQGDRHEHAALRTQLDGWLLHRVLRPVAVQPDVWPDVEQTRGGSGRTTRYRSTGVMSLLLNNIFDT